MLWCYHKKGGKKTFGMFMALIMMMIPWVYYFQTHQIVYIKYIQLLYVNYYLII